MYLYISLALSLYIYTHIKRPLYRVHTIQNQGEKENMSEHIKEKKKMEGGGAG